MSDSEIDPLQKLAKLRDLYARELPLRVEDLISRWEVFNAKPDSVDEIEEQIRAFHTLAGSGASYGYPEVTRLCRDIENIMQLCQQTSIPLDSSQGRDIEEKLSELKQVAQQEPQDIINAVEGLSRVGNHKEEYTSLIYVLEDDKMLSEELSTHLGIYGYKVRTFETAEVFAKAFQKQRPDLLVIDIFLPDADGTSVLKRLNQSAKSMPPAIIVSQRADTRARLRAVRAGAAAFFEKPLNISKLIDKIDSIVNPLDEDPFRVLIVDDDKATGDFTVATLENSGFVARAEINPIKVMDTIIEFNPELILMDLYMPNCDGYELAEVIRQQENYLGMPIVYLSSETNLEKQLSAMHKGGDDFLTKPIRPDHLISAVTSRIRRYRQLSSLMVRDSLTGLYNHTSIKEILDKEVSRSVRHKMPLSYAMVDIDYFKKVNDTYGHSTGDRVIKLLTRLLTQRLRKSDYVGRYGGEEFAVIMPETDAVTAKMVLDELREEFSKIVVRSEEREFKSTFSCGVSDCPTFDDMTSIAEAADKALYQAKGSGRNQVVCAAVPQELLEGSMAQA